MPLDSALRSRIRKLREGKRLTQERVARALGLTRQTYLSVEKGQRDLSVSELQALAELFEMDACDLLGDSPSGRGSVVELGAPGKTRRAPAQLRIRVPQHQVEKFKEVLLYVLSRVGALPHVGETVIYKLLYFIDFDYYEKYEEHLMGATYLKNKFGPAPVEFKAIVVDMEERGEIERVRSKHFQYDQSKYLPRRAARLEVLCARELQHIDEVLARLGDKNARAISEYSHEDVPWLVTKAGQPIDYETVFYRTPKTSVRGYAL